MSGFLGHPEGLLNHASPSRKPAEAKTVAATLLFDPEALITPSPDFSGEGPRKHGEDESAGI